MVNEMRRNTLKGMGAVAGLSILGPNLSASELKKGELLFVSKNSKDYVGENFKIDTVKEIDLLANFKDSSSMIDNELIKFGRAVGVLDNANFTILNSIAKRNDYTINRNVDKDFIIFKIKKDEKWQNI
ncbi:MAG: hypothetical protein GXZ15_05055 [Campylobacter sp.]|nr:hypothetical protein [Campylobacter sp.]